MIEWATNNGKAARQRSVRQETTLFKAGILPLNMYRAPDYPKDEVPFSVILEIVITRAAPAFHNLFMVMGCVFDINTVHKTIEKLTFQVFY